MENAIEEVKSQIQRKGIPTTTSYRIIIPVDMTTWQFNRYTYKDQYLADYISKKEYDEIINQASKIMYNCWVTKRQNDTFNLPKHFLKLICYLIGITFLYLLFLVITPNIKNPLIVVIISSLLFCTIFVLMIFLFILNIKKPFILFKTLEEILEQEINNYLTPINKKYEKILDFKYKSESYYLECKIISKFQNEEEKSPLKNEGEEKEGDIDIGNQKEKKVIEENQPLVNLRDEKNKSFTNDYRKEGDTTNLMDIDNSNLHFNQKNEIELVEVRKKK